MSAVIGASHVPCSIRSGADQVWTAACAFVLGRLAQRSSELANV